MRSAETGLHTWNPPFGRNTSIHTEPDIHIPQLVEQARSQYPVRVAPHSNFGMVYGVSHFNRMIDNSRRNEANAQDIEVIAPHTYDLPWEDNGIKGTNCQPQDMPIWVLIELIGCPHGCGHSQAVQGVVYIVMNMAGDETALQMRSQYL